MGGGLLDDDGVGRKLLGEGRQHCFWAHTRRDRRLSLRCWLCRPSVAEGCQLVEQGVDHWANRADDGVAYLRQDGLSGVVDDLHQSGVRPYWLAAGGYVIGEY